MQEEEEECEEAPCNFNVEKVLLLLQCFDFGFILESLSRVNKSIPLSLSLLKPATSFLIAESSYSIRC